MKRILSTLLLTTAAFTSFAQARFSSHTETVALGQIEWKHPVTAQYTITNTGNEPLVLANVVPDCACTVACYTMTPIAPGAKGSITVTFDAKMLGHFRKSVAVHTNAQPHLLYLHLEGEVVQEIKDFTRTHPYLIGEIRIDKNSIDFPDMERGGKSSLQVGVVNLSDRSYEPVLMHLPPYLQVETTPTVLQKGEKGVITLTLDSEKLTDWGLTQSSVYLSRFAGDKVGEENEIPVSAILIPDFSSLTAAERENAPVVKLSATELDMRELLAKKNKVSQQITLTNTGRTPLIISKLQVFSPAVGVSLKKNVLKPGESTRLKVTVNKRTKVRRKILRVLMITNDPAQPKVEINILKE